MTDRTSNGVNYNERYRRTRPVMYGDIEQLFMALGVIDDYLMWLQFVQGWTLPGSGDVIRRQVADARAIARALYGAGPDEMQPVETSALVWKRMCDEVPVNGMWIWWDYVNCERPSLQRAQDFSSEDGGYWIEAVPPSRSPVETTDDQTVEYARELARTRKSLAETIEYARQTMPADRYQLARVMCRGVVYE